MSDEEKKAIEKFKFCGGNFVLDKESSKVVLNLIEKLQKENERLKKQVEYDKIHIYTPRTIELNYVSKQKIKDKIEEYKNMLKTCNKAKDENRMDIISEDEDIISYRKALLNSISYSHKPLCSNCEVDYKCKLKKYFDLYNINEKNNLENNEEKTIELSIKPIIYLKEEITLEKKADVWEISN